MAEIMFWLQEVTNRIGTGTVISMVLILSVMLIILMNKLFSPRRHRGNDQTSSRNNFQTSNRNNDRTSDQNNEQTNDQNNEQTNDQNEEVARLMREFAAGMLSASEQGNFKLSTGKNITTFESSVIIRGGDVEEQVRSGKLDGQEQMLEFLDSNVGSQAGGMEVKFNGVEVKFDAEGKPAQVLVNGQIIDLSDRLH